MSEPQAMTAGKLAYTIAEACAATGIGRSLLYERISEGRLVARKDGGKTIILAADLVAYLTALPAVETKQ